MTANAATIKIDQRAHEARFMAAAASKLRTGSNFRKLATRRGNHWIRRSLRAGERLDHV